MSRDVDVHVRTRTEQLEQLELTGRQRLVLRALVSAYVGAAAPVGSATVSHLLPVNLSSASIRNTMAELNELGLIQKPHASAGRVPTERGLRHFVDRLLEAAELAAYERRTLAHSFEDVEASNVMHVASQLLSDTTHLLGFVLAPRLERVVLRHVSLVRLSTDRLLVVLVSRTGETHRRVIEYSGSGDQPELDRMAAALRERVVNRTLGEVRDLLRRELRELHSEADRIAKRALTLGLRALEFDESPADLVIASHLELLNQPEFDDADRIRELFEAIETQEYLMHILDETIGAEGVSVTLGGEFEEPTLRRCALVVAPYGGDLGVLGVIGPSRMDYGRVMALVGLCSDLMTEKLHS